MPKRTSVFFVMVPMLALLLPAVPAHAQDTEMARKKCVEFGFKDKTANHESCVKQLLQSIGGGKAPSKPAAAPAAPAVSPMQREDKFWDDAKAAGNKEAFEAYLASYPNGAYAGLARANIKRFVEAAESERKTLVEVQPNAQARATSESTAEANYQRAVQLATPNNSTSDDTEAVRLFRMAAVQGHSGAQVWLGLLHQNGRGGLAKDDVEAVRLYRLAANQGNAQGQNSLGFMYQLGLGGLAKDAAEAVRLYRLSANQGDALGQFNLGNMHEHGQGGLAKDMSPAIALYRLAAAQGNTSAKSRLLTLGVTP
jgi:TPR repeat protein